MILGQRPIGGLTVGVQVQGAVGQAHGVFQRFVHLVVALLIIGGIHIREHGHGQSVFWLYDYGPFQGGAGLDEQLGVKRGRPLPVTQNRVIHFQVITALGAGFFEQHTFDEAVIIRQAGHHMLGDFVLNGKQLGRGQLAFKLLRPQIGTRGRIGQSGEHAQRAAADLHAAVQHKAHPQAAGDFAYVLGGRFKLAAGVRIGNNQVVEAGQADGNFLGQAFGEVFNFNVVANICKRQHGHGRGVGHALAPALSSRAGLGIRGSAFHRNSHARPERGHISALGHVDADGVITIYIVVSFQFAAQFARFHTHRGVGLGVEAGLAPEHAQSDSVSLKIPAPSRKGFQHQKFQQPLESGRSLKILTGQYPVQLLGNGLWAQLG